MRDLNNGIRNTYLHIWNYSLKKREKSNGSLEATDHWLYTIGLLIYLEMVLIWFVSFVREKT